MLYFDQVHEMLTPLLGAAQPDDLIMKLSAGLQNAFHLDDRIGFTAGHKEHDLIGPIIEPTVVDKTQVEQQQHAFGQSGHRAEGDARAGTQGFKQHIAQTNP